MSFDRFAQRMWYERRYRMLSIVLWPLSLIFAAAVAIRRWAYRSGLLASVRLECPVVIVGNVTVGGTGKTPLVLWLASECERRGLRAAIVCRGHGGRATHSPVTVTAASEVTAVGDEAVLLAQSFPGLVVACRDRVEGARHAVSRGAQLVLCDDGLQHYRLQRDAEIVVVDAAREYGNARLLPSGPLREPIARVRSAQLIVRTHRDSTDGPQAARPTHQMPSVIDVGARIEYAVALRSGESRPLASFVGARVHALAGIGNPDAFFDMLRAQGLEVDARALSDHALITPADLDFGDPAPVLMTEKDAVKCRGFADARAWYVPLSLEIREEHRTLLWSVLESALELHGRHH
jgi:tetraacyldisaccharide 4'-kinase